MKRKLAFLLVLIAAVILLGACRGGADPAPATPAPATPTPAPAPATPEPEVESPFTPHPSGHPYVLQGPFPLVEERHTLTLFMQSQPTWGEWDDLEIMVMLEELTNVRIEVDSVQPAQFMERYSLLVATNQLPDIFLGATGGGREDELARDGQIIPLQDLIPVFAPNLQLFLDENPLHRTIITSLDGNIYGTGSFTRTATQGSNKIQVNNDIYAEWGGTFSHVDDFVDFLRFSQANHPDRYPFSGRLVHTSFGSETENAFLGWFGEITSGGGRGHLNIRDGQVHFIPLGEGWRATLSFMKYLIDNGLLHESFITESVDDYNARIGTGMVTSSPNLHLGPNNMDNTVIRPLISDINDVRMSPAIGHSSIAAFAISNTNPHPELSMAWWDLFWRSIDNTYWTEDGIGFNGILSWQGRQGVDWEIHPSREFYQQLYIPRVPADWGGNPWTWHTTHVSPGFTLGLIDLLYPPEDDYLRWVAESNFRALFPYLDPLGISFPAATRFLAEETHEIGTLRADIITVIVEFRALYLSGANPCWDEKEAMLNGIGLQRYLELQQIAYDRFMRLMGN